MAKATKNYWIGDIPGKPLSLQVLDQYGNQRDLSGLNVRLHMLDTDNRNIDLTGAEVDLLGVSQGRVIFRFPTDRSLFPKHGEYVIQLELYREGVSRDKTNQFTLKVEKSGEVYR